MAEADNKTTTSQRVLTLPQAEELIGREELKRALEEGCLLATDRENWALCEKIFPVFRRAMVHVVPQADLDAIEAISRRNPIPRESWWRWIEDGSVNWQTGEVVRDYLGRTVIFRPMLRSAGVLAQVPAHVPAQTATGGQAANKTPTGSWITAEARCLKAAGKISEDVSKTDSVTAGRR